MFAVPVAEYLAPFEDADVKGIGICVHPELVCSSRSAFSEAGVIAPPCAVERQVAQEVAADNGDTAEAFLAAQGCWAAGCGGVH